MDGAKTRVMGSLQVWLSLAASVVIILLAIVGGALSFFEAYGDAAEVQDEQLRAVSQAFGRHGLPLPQQPQKVRKVEGLSRIVIEPVGAGEGWLFHLPLGIADGYHTIDVDGEPWRIYVRTTKVTRTRFAVGQRTMISRRIARDTVVWTALPLLALVPILCGLIYGLTWRGLMPVVALAANLDRRSPTDLSFVPASGLPVELRPIASAMNSMIVRVRNALDAQRRFISDAAHELRSPFAVLSLQAQNLEGAKNPREMAERLVPLRQGLARASALLEQLLSLAHARAPAEGEQASVPVADALRTVIEKSLPLAEQKNIELDIERLEPVAVAAREIDLVLILRNLLDNAIRYSPAGGRVRIAAYADRGGVHIEVADDGPGVPESERERVFEPFFRLKGSVEGGSGLGLSIVREVVQRLGGSLVLADSNAAGPRGLRVLLTLPAAVHGAG
jgi:two-component system OmpR family sensor kinase